jgi:subtilisin family serine protease
MNLPPGAPTLQTSNRKSTKKVVSLLVLLPFLTSCRPVSQDSLRTAGVESIPVRRAAPVGPKEKLSGTLRQLIEDPISNQKLRVLVDLTAQVDLNKLGEFLVQRGASKRERRQIVVAALKQVAEQSQSDLRPFLEELKGSDQVESYKSFSIVNRLLVTATPSGIQTLADQEEVAAIVEEVEERTPALTITTAHTIEPHRSSWAIQAIGTDKVRNQGLDGSGTVVGIIDTGASAAHEQLRGNYRGGERSWFDPSSGSALPQDARFGHGTGILSCAVGQNCQGITLGVAPEARWVACAGLPEGRYNNVFFTQCADWMLSVGQPDVLINSWLTRGKSCDPSLRQIIDAWRAAEIFPIFAAGNKGPEAQTDGSPANYVGLYPGDGVAFSVGGTLADGTVFARSSRGPNSCDGSIYPVLTAPAENITAAFPLTPSSYVQAKGTSFSVGFIAGAAALLLQRYPQATVSELEEALKSSATDMGTPGPDNTFGYGQLYIPSALESLARILEKKEKSKSAHETAR